MKCVPRQRSVSTWLLVTSNRYTGNSWHPACAQEHVLKKRPERNLSVLPTDWGQVPDCLQRPTCRYAILINGMLLEYDINTSFKRMLSKNKHKSVI